MAHELQLRSISDDDLLRRLSELLRKSRRIEADLVAHIGEVDQRRLYAREASPSMFTYCTERLHLSEAAAHLRITVARAAREHPILLEMLGDGRLHLRGIAKLAPHLSRENRDLLLERAAHKSKRQIEELVAELAPKPDVPALTRKLPQPRKPKPARQLCPGRVVAPAARIPAFRHHPGSQEEPRRDGHDTLVPLRSRSRPAGGLRAGWRPVPVRGRARQTLSEAP